MPSAQCLPHGPRRPRRVASLLAAPSLPQAPPAQSPSSRRFSLCQGSYLPNCVDNWKSVPFSGAKSQASGADAARERTAADARTAGRGGRVPGTVTPWAQQGDADSRPGRVHGAGANVLCS